MPVALHGSILARTLTKMTAEGLPIRDENREVPAEGLLFVDAAGGGVLGRASTVGGVGLGPPGDHRAGQGAQAGAREMTGRAAS